MGNRIASMFQQQQAQSTATSRPAASASSATNGHLSEDEALERAMQASLTQGHQGQQQQIRAPTNQEEQDRMLAQALAESEREASRRRQQTSQDSANKTCEIS